LKELEAGLRGIGDWLDYIEQTHPSGYYWDPTKKIRAESRRNLAMIKARDLRWEELARNVEWIGREIELEIDRARDDERLDRETEGESEEP